MNERKRVTVEDTMPAQRDSVFEERVLLAIKKLEAIGFAKALTFQDRVRDQDGNVGKIDIAFVLHTHLIDLLISVECKGQERPISLADINQIKVLKQGLPERNLFWLIVEDAADANSLTSLSGAGIALYDIDTLEKLISDINDKYRKSDIGKARCEAKMLSKIWPSMFWEVSYRLQRKEIACLEGFEDAHAIFVSGDRSVNQGAG
jgi:hypothetical protein